MYLQPDDVRTLVTTLRERFPGAELIAEIASSQAVRMLGSRFGRGKFKRQFGLSENVVYTFGMDTPRDMEAWAPGIKLLDEWTYFDEDEPKLGWYRWFAKWPMARSIQYTVHYRLGSSSTELPLRSAVPHSWRMR